MAHQPQTTLCQSSTNKQLTAQTTLSLVPHDATPAGPETDQQLVQAATPRTPRLARLQHGSPAQVGLFNWPVAKLQGKLDALLSHHKVTDSSMQQSPAANCPPLERRSSEGPHQGGLLLTPAAAAAAHRCLHGRQQRHVLCFLHQLATGLSLPCASGAKAAAPSRAELSRAELSQAKPS